MPDTLIRYRHLRVVGGPMSIPRNSRRGGHAACHQATPSLLKQVPSLPREVEEVLFKALAKNPKDRFASMQVFLQALQEVSDSLPTLDELSDESFPKEISSGASKLASPLPVADPPTRFPSRGDLEPTVFSPHQEQPVTKTEKALSTTGPVQQTLPTTIPPRQRIPLPARRRTLSKKQVLVLLVISILLMSLNYKGNG